MKNTRGQYRIRAAFFYAVNQVLQIAHAAAGDHRNIQRIGNRPGQCQIKTIFLPVPVHAGQQDFTRTQVLHFFCPRHRVEAGGIASAVSEYFPMPGRNLLGIDRYYNALRTITPGGIGDQLRIKYRSGVDADFIGSRIQQIAHVAHFAHAATDGQRNKNLRGNLLDDAENNSPIVRAGGDVEEGQLIRALFIITTRNFYGIAGIAQFDKAHAFDDPAGSHIKTRNDALGEHELA